MSARSGVLARLRVAFVLAAIGACGDDAEESGAAGIAGSSGVVSSPSAGAGTALGAGAGAGTGGVGLGVAGMQSSTRAGAGGMVALAGSGGVSGAAAGSGAAGKAGAAGSMPIAGMASTPPVPVDSSEELYDDTRVPRFDIDLPQASVAALGNDPDTYARGTLRYGSETVADIGVRIKGEASLRTLERKAAFKLKFDEFVPEQNFRGLRRMTLNNMVEDPTFMAERLAYLVYRTAKLPAPRCNSALVYVNGQLFGVYANVETEDKTFLRRWFASDDGNLYEEGQRDFETGAEMQFDLETNEQANDRSDLRNLISVIQNARPASLVADWDAALDMRHYFRFTAAEAAVNQWDMYSYTVFYPNNFRLYHDPTSNKFVFLPWGMDMSMKPYRDSGRQFIEIFGLARSADRANAKITAGLVFQRCLANADCKARYAEAVREVAAVYESANLEAVAMRYHQQIEEHVRSDPRKEYSQREFDAGYQSLLSTIRGRVAAIKEDLAE